ncbi:hypothetical protein LIA77_11849 [Sarocladium implicatum]|nr:hypothetical protein LIA77_11849 [Sarocladium implicatum]
MDKATILTASRVEPNVLPYSTEILITSLSPIFESAIQLQRVLSAVSLQILLQTFIAARLTLTVAAWSSKFCAVHVFVLIRNGAWISGQVVWWTWTSKGVIALREQTFRNFATWVLGSGNGLILVFFWPGWWLVAGGSCAVWICCG